MQPIQTARLRLRPFEDADEEAAFGFFGDPEVMRYSLNGVHTSRKQTEECILTNMHRQERTGYSIWAVIEHSSGDLIGMCGLAEFRHGSEGTDLAYHLRRDRWRKAYASEAGLGTVEHAFTALRIDRLFGLVEPANVASARVLEKCRLEPVSRRKILGREAFVFEAMRNDWLWQQF